MATIISRGEALSSGLTHYFTGKPCRRGHIAQRRTHGCCVVCRRDYKAETGTNRNDIEKLRTLRITRPDIRRAGRAAGKYRKAQRTPPWFDPAACRAIYRQATEATQRTGVPHHVDHIIPLNGALVSGLHVHQNLQVLPGLDNIRKSNRFDPGLH